MDDVIPLPINWSENSTDNSLVIVLYLRSKFSQRETDNFYNLLAAFESQVTISPEIYPIINERLQIRRAVLSKPLSVFYIYSAEGINVLDVLDNRMSDARWPK